MDKEKCFNEQEDNAMKWEDNVIQFQLTTLARIRQYCEVQGSEQEPDVELDAMMGDVARTVKMQAKRYNKYSNEHKFLFVYMNKVKLFNAAKSGRLASGIAERTALKVG
ncbi:hypothetical protein BDB00DRAFT_887982 [Zychaea mexicana]|uniref:uncharacterized protein n=1 Tax=Zychaea mexicana TaxID=64656 RepID=UPI0022FE3E9F|nr:uncharacterized protein BDB00DRAFT_887982 [Zychaea mexicana]KAI9496961.1 hypothetical protein BDB00DRAFT_887982 [Zychaea mexicana]